MRPRSYNINASRPAGQRPLASMEDNKVPTKDILWCDVCFRQFDRKSRLMAHYKTHTGERPYHCPYCSKSFASKGNCNTHIRVHTRERPYMCQHCGKQFSQHGQMETKDLVIHMNGSHPNEVSQADVDDSHPNEEDRRSFKLNVETALMALVGKSTISQLAHPNRNVEQVLVSLLDVVGMSPCVDVRVDEDERLRVNMRKLLEYGLPEPSAWRSLGWHQEAIEAITAKIASDPFIIHYNPRLTPSAPIHDNLSGRNAEIWKSD
ncbi:hypothetical protein HAZT_HAZT010142 [Hyalella azteca]|uniref:C2H2-type domain-containing protein n=1 Tax=Hyalella azteca TaxID=294128 RepID=A0A6A0H644_HYAAZ|nr:hypothetical protein HAZT_HAZT010142 [Hyalella azteca]